MWMRHKRAQRRFMALADVECDAVGREPLRILFLADDRHAANVVLDHLSAFPRFSRHAYTILNPIHDEAPTPEFTARFDVILIHYSIYILSDYFLPAPWVPCIATFPGLKVQLVQDEFRHIEAMKQRMADLGLRCVVSILDVDCMRKVYAGKVVRKVRFYSSLPGYIDDNYRSFDPVPIAERRFDVVYRGRTLPAYLGEHALLKKRIGDQFQAIARQHGLKVDISSAESERIYGAAWPEFLGSSRATLGVEGGMSMFDFSGEFEAQWHDYHRYHPDCDDEEEVWRKMFADQDGNIVYKTITPKFFEAIALKTALVLYPGHYNGILRPGEHYILLEPDGSNADEVVEKLRDTAYLQALVDRAYADIMPRRDLSARFFVEQFDRILDAQWPSTRRSKRIREFRKKLCKAK